MDCLVFSINNICYIFVFLQTKIFDKYVLPDLIILIVLERYIWLTLFLSFYYKRDKGEIYLIIKNKKINNNSIKIVIQELN